MAPCDANSDAIGSPRPAAWSSIIVISSRKIPRLRWVGSTPTIVMPAVGTLAPPGVTICWLYAPAQPTMRSPSNAANVRSSSATFLSVSTSSGSGRGSENATLSDAKKSSTSSGTIARKNRSVIACSLSAAAARPVSVEQRVETDGEAGSARDGPNGEQYARHERRPVERVVAEREHLPRAAEQHLFMGHQSGQANGVDATPVYVGTTGSRVGADRVRRGPLPRPCRVDRTSGGQRRAARRVGLSVMVELDHLGGIEESRGRRREPQKQRPREPEVGRHHAVRVRASREFPNLVEVIGRHPRRADDGVHAALEAPADVPEDRRGMGEVDAALGAGVRERVERASDRDTAVIAARLLRVDCGDELKVIGGRDGSPDLATHAAGGAEDADADHA